LFYEPTAIASRELIRNWVCQLLNYITIASPDREYLDEITASEIADLAYLEATPLAEAIAAHALYPPEIEQAEAQSGYGANSSMEVTFPIVIEDEHWGYEVVMRAGRPSVVGIGRGGIFPSNKPAAVPPSEMLSPRIKGAQYRLQEEQGGRRLIALAGPLEVLRRAIKGEVREPNGSAVERFALEASSKTYAYADDKGRIFMQEGEGGLEPLDSVPTKIKGFYVRQERNKCAFELKVSWEQRQPGEALMKVGLYIAPSEAQGHHSTSRDKSLSALVLPHVQVRLRGASAAFPRQQYAESKRHYLALSDEERHEEANHKLYQVRQSGCIATCDPTDTSRVTLTTFGIFDTPREIPVPGPEVSSVAAGPDALLSFLPEYSERTEQFVRQHWDVICSVLLAAAEAFKVSRFHQFQWDAITTGIQLKAEGRDDTTTIVRAPTGAGKTVVFMVNAAIASLCGKERSTSVLLFPTRLLNEDMFRRLTAFIYGLRKRMPSLNVAGGILMGTYDELYKLVNQPKEGEVMFHYGTCPACDKQGRLIALPSGPDSKLLPTCEKCGYSITYMFDPYQVLERLPDIVIATPDKLFSVATSEPQEAYRYALLGAPYRRCQECGRAHAEAGLQLRAKAGKVPCNQVFKGSTCTGTFAGPLLIKPIRYMGFDEVHSWYGETATYLSTFLATLEAMQRVLSGQSDLSIRYETATATIANERALLEAITRRGGDSGEIIAIPADGQVSSYFSIEDDSIRHRVLLTLPARVTSRQATLIAILNSYRHLHGPCPDLKERLKKIVPPDQLDAWDFILGYVFKKQDGSDLRRALRNFYQNSYNESLNIQFLSGSSPKNQIIKYIDQARSGEVDILIANLVLSLGINFTDLNHMFMFGVPRSFTEYAQIVGRLGRGKASGHANILLLPYWPRDTYLYRHFHAVFSDVAGYYDVLPVRSTNLHCSEEIFGNIFKGIVSAYCMKKGEWTHRNGVLRALEGKEARVLGGIARLLCDDETLKSDTESIVRRKYPTLKAVIQSPNSEFLAPMMKQRGWLLTGLRAHSENTIRIVCADQQLLERISASLVALPAADEVDETDTDPSAEEQE
jgi:hypothetical protein